MYRQVNQQALQAEASKAAQRATSGGEKGEGGGFEFLSLKDGEQVALAFLPPFDESGLPYKEVRSIYIPGLKATHNLLADPSVDPILKLANERQDLNARFSTKRYVSAFRMDGQSNKPAVVVLGLSLRVFEDLLSRDIPPAQLFGDPSQRIVMVLARKGEGTDTRYSWAPVGNVGLDGKSIPQVFDLTQFVDTEHLNKWFSSPPDLNQVFRCSTKHLDRTDELLKRLGTNAAQVLNPGVLPQNPFTAQNLAFQQRKI